MSTPKQQFLDALDREHATTVRVLRAYPSGKDDLRPHEKCKTARELAWVFVAERGLARMVLEGQFPQGMQGEMPKAPESWDATLAALEEAHAGFRALVASIPEGDLGKSVKFFTGPKTIGDVPRLDFLWFLLHDEIHHRGQFSIYLRMADGKVPSIYGPTADEPWM
jgi:uncharacterized damage-inducible protein DinB